MAAERQAGHDQAYLAALRARREIDDAEEERLDDAIDRLYDLQHHPFKVVELSATTDEEQVAEIFVRINSEVRAPARPPASRRAWRVTGPVAARP